MGLRGNGWDWEAEMMKSVEGSRVGCLRVTKTNCDKFFFFFFFFLLIDDNRGVIS